MDTPSWSSTSLHPLVAMVLQEPSRVDLPAGRSDVGTAGSARWPLTPAGPAQTILSALRHAAQTLGYTVPETLCVQAGQLFYHNGCLEEVRLPSPAPKAACRPRSVSRRTRHHSC
jgi:hypothetical protein